MVATGVPLIRVGLLALAVLALLTAPLAARNHEQRLSKAEILEILTGNTAIGLGEGRPWRQYFAPDGTTPYVVEGQQIDLGRWRVTDDAVYESWWQATGWTRYTMTAAGDLVTWIALEGEARYPARIVAGMQLR